MRATKVLGFAAAAFGLLWGGLASAQGGLPVAAVNYPVRTVRIIVPYGPGGPTDIVARLVGHRLAEISGQAFVVENHAGAAATVGTSLAARAPADGYTVLFATNDLAAQPSLSANLSYDPRRSFTAVTTIASSPEVVVVHPSVPASTMTALIDLVRSRPGTFSYASPGTGTTTHMASVRLFAITHKLDLAHVPHGGGGPAILAVLAGHTQVAYTAFGAAAPFVKDGSLRALAITGTKRFAGFDAVPTLAEAGIPGHESDVMIGAVVTTGTPREVVDWLQQNIARVVAEPAVRERLTALGFDPVADTPDQIAKRIEAEIVKWAKIVVDGGLRTR